MTFGAIFPGGSKKAFVGLQKSTLGVLGFRGSVAGRGVCKSCSEFVEYEHPLFRARSATTSNRNLQFWGAVSTGFFYFLHWIFFPFLQVFLCNLVRKSPQNVEKIARFPGGEKSAESCHVSGCHGFLVEIHELLVWPFLLVCRGDSRPRVTTKGQNRFSALSHTSSHFPHIFTLSQTFSPRASLKIKAFFKGIKRKRPNHFAR